MKKGKRLVFVVWAVLLVSIMVPIGLLLVPKQVAIEATDADLEFYLAKTKVVLHENSASIDDIVFVDYQSQGRQPVDVILTSTEVTAIVNKVSSSDSILTDIRVRFIDDDRYIVSAQLGNDFSRLYRTYEELKPYASILESTLSGRSIYLEWVLTQWLAVPFTGHVTSVIIGQISFSVDQANTYLDFLGNE